ncbi:hypothetical protein BC833DRAFT_651204 [Globomyces pollinis-pini]|nr:hypothetical protein BC833DRAFT_651204 [Globomyces pollinis-pini]
MNNYLPISPTKSTQSDKTINMTQSTVKVSSTLPSMDKKQLRLMKNREAADASRKRKKLQSMMMAESIQLLETENTALKAQLSQLNQTILTITSENIQLKKIIQQNNIQISKNGITDTTSNNFGISGTGAMNVDFDINLPSKEMDVEYSTPPPLFSSDSTSSNASNASPTLTSTSLNDQQWLSTLSTFFTAPSLPGSSQNSQSTPLSADMQLAQSNCEPIFPFISSKDPIFPFTTTNDPSIPCSSSNDHLSHLKEDAVTHDYGQLFPFGTENNSGFTSNNDVNSPRFHQPDQMKSADDLFEEFLILDPKATDNAAKRSGLGVIFTMIIFSFASFLVPFQPTSQPTNSPTVSPPTIMSSIAHDVVSTSTVSASVDPWYQIHPVHSTALSLDKAEFISTIQSLSKINPPNAMLSIESLFDTSIDNTFSISADYATISNSLPNQKQSNQNSFFDSTIMLQPTIKLIPYSPKNPDDVHPNDPLRLSLLASIPSVSGLGVEGTAGILKLDMQVFAATWLK